MRSLEARLCRLEAAQGGKGRLHVFTHPRDLDASDIEETEFIEAAARHGATFRPDKDQAATIALVGYGRPIDGPPPTGRVRHSYSIPIQGA